MQKKNLHTFWNIFIIYKYNLIETGGDMINKKNLWFLTLFSLILVLSIYYITMPSELLISGNTKESKKEIKNCLTYNIVNRFGSSRIFYC